ncbi:MAG TPA: hypothetical protein VFT72_20095 [Opitutaceae bacterium]|nr:hypothetical protein [Opitutaceae bacterium]
MTKWILVAAVVIAVAAFVLIQRSGTKTVYVNGLPEYNTLPGKEYIFERDCYIFKLDNEKTSYPLVGANAPDLPSSVSQLPNEVTDANVGKELPGVRILDTVHVGDRFKIVSVRRDEKRDSTRVTFEILFINESERRYPRLDAYYILDHSPEAKGAAPRMIDGYAVERVKK